jgi:hypothetical protein
MKLSTRVVLLFGVLVTLPLGLDGFVAYSQAAVRSSNDECGKPPARFVKQVARVSVRKGYVPLTSKLLAKVKKPKPKVEDCDVIKPIALPALLIDSPAVESVPEIVKVEPVSAVESVAGPIDQIDKPHAYIAALPSYNPAVVGTPTQYAVVPWVPSFSALGSWFASPIYFTSIFNYYGPVVPTPKPTSVNQDKPVSVPVVGSFWLLIAGWVAAYAFLRRVGR